MPRNAVRHRSTLAQEWREARPPTDGGWSLRLRFFCIALSFAVCSWAGLRAMSGRISFAWILPVTQQAQALAAPFQQTSRGLAFPTVGHTSSPLTQQGIRAQGVPIAATIPTVAAPPVVVVPPATPAAAIPAATAQPRAAVATARPDRTATASARNVPATLTPVATSVADLLAGPHTTYVVHAGDTLYGIAHRVGVAVDVLAAMNHLAPPYKIIVGKLLLIPAA